MSVIKIIWIIISNGPTIIRLIKEIIELINSLSGERSVDERMIVKQAKRTAFNLGKKSGIGAPPSLVMD